MRRLEKAFRKRTCPPNINLLLGGDAVDSYYSPACVAEINKHDRTPRNNWQNIAPELLHACSYCLPYLEPQAFCYVLPAYLRVMLERPYYLEGVPITLSFLDTLVCGIQGQRVTVLEYVMQITHQLAISVMH